MIHNHFVVVRSATMFSSNCLLLSANIIFRREGIFHYFGEFKEALQATDFIEYTYPD